jgi:hypothetical protein
MNLLRKHKFFLILLFSTVLIKIVEWKTLFTRFIPHKVEGNEYDIIEYTKLFFVSLHLLFLFTDLSLILMLSVCLLFKS